MVNLGRSVDKEGRVIPNTTLSYIAYQALEQNQLKKNIAPITGQEKNFIQNHSNKLSLPWLSICGICLRQGAYPATVRLE